MAHSFVFNLRDLDKSQLAKVGGKAANLGELFWIAGILVPDGFCVATEAFKNVTGQTGIIEALIAQLSKLKAEDRTGIATLSADIRRHIEEAPVPEEIAAAIRLHISGDKAAYAVRSSATAEDLPSASFAGQQDTYLNIIGEAAILEHIRKCWASLYTERAVIYRLQNGFDHRKVQLAVVVQKMVFPQVSGIMFTADPVTSNRKVLSVDASFGLGEALVAGIVNADHYKVSKGEVMEKRIAVKKLEILALKNGGTKTQEITSDAQQKQALTDGQILQLEGIGRKIEAHFEQPQDIEWCLADGEFYVVQSRPITTLYPIPEAPDQENHVYISVGHQQMMTDAIKPLGLSFWLLTAMRPMNTAGGRLFVDVTDHLASEATRNMMLNLLVTSDPLIKDALSTLLARDNFIKQKPDPVHKVMPAFATQPSIESDPAIVARLVKQHEAAIVALKQGIQSKSGVAVFDFITEDLTRLKQFLFDPQGSAAIMAAINASTWINEKMNEWLGEKNAADTLSQSVANNVTSEMGLALLDVADVIRPYPAVINYLQQVKDDDFLDGLMAVDGGLQAYKAITAYLDKYGMRCAGEIDITKPRWSEKPAILIPVVLNHIKNFEPGESVRKYERGLHEALNKEKELLSRLKQLPDGEQKATDTKQMIDLLRHFAGYREYPKYGWVSCYAIYKEALLKEAGQLAETGILHHTTDVYYLTFEEFRQVVQTGKADYEIINRRKEEFFRYEKLAPPRVITSDGEIINGAYHRENLPAAAIAGLAVSSGIIEGRARVILKMEDAVIEAGDILVTTFTDPSWTPLFVSISGLVTEVGGLMTHGAVIAREYGLPAVVGVAHATKLIKDGQRIRVNGTDGYVEVL